MARPTMRRLPPLVLSLLFLMSAAPTPSAAQETSDIRLTLLSQTPWTCPTATGELPLGAGGFRCTAGRELEVRFRAENLGSEPLDELAIGVTLFSRVLSRSAFEASLVEDPADVIDAETLPRQGTLDPGVPRDFAVTLTMDVFGIDADQSGIYPLKIDVRSGVSSVAALRTPTIFLVREPEVPLALSWTFVLHHPITFAPDGTFTDPSLEISLDAGGRLHGEIRSLLELVTDGSRTPVDVAISPVLLTQLGRMRDGYAVIQDGRRRLVAEGEGGAVLAEQALEDLRTIVVSPSLRVSTLPFSAPELPALYGGGLVRDVDVQLERGRAVTSSFTGTMTSATVLRPPGAALDDVTLRGLSSSGIDTLILDPSTVALPDQPLGFAGPATTLVGGGTLSGIVPEPTADDLLASTVGNDPVLAAQVLLGSLASIWQERPGERRAVALLVSEDAPFPGPFFVPFVRGIAGAPWLDPTGAAQFVEEFPPSETSVLADPSFRRFPPTYVALLKQARRRVDTLRSMLPPASRDPDQLETMLLLAEARQFLNSPTEGLAFVDAVRERVRERIDALTLDTVSTLTFTTESGSIPVTVSNDGERPLSFTVSLVSQWLRETPSADLELRPGETETVRLLARLRSTGRFPVTVQMLSPSGRPIGRETLVVRSTAYNRIALFITIGAGLLVVLLWARRFVPRRTS